MSSRSRQFLKRQLVARLGEWSGKYEWRRKHRRLSNRTKKGTGKNPSGWPRGFHPKKKRKAP